jgi:hypothetical protein
MTTDRCAHGCLPWVWCRECADPLTVFEDEHSALPIDDTRTTVAGVAILAAVAVVCLVVGIVIGRML